MKNDGVGRAVSVLMILFNYSDKDHYLTLKEIMEILEVKYGIKSYRTTIQKDIAALINAGLGIECTRSTQNRYSYTDKTLEPAEIRILIDAVAAARFISPNISSDLINRLTGLAGESARKKISSGRSERMTYKTKNSRTIYITDVIEEAMSLSNKISFVYGTSETDRKQRIVSPYRLVWHNELYILIGYDELEGRLRYFRTDMIYEVPQILNERIKRDVASQDILQMSGAPFIPECHDITNVTLVFEKDVIGVVMDFLGQDIVVKNAGNNLLKTQVNISCGKVFFSWIFMSAGKISIQSPYRIKEAYKDMVRSEYRRIVTSRTKK